MPSSIIKRKSSAHPRILVALLLLAIGAFAVALSAGSVAVDWAEVLEGLNGRDLSVDYTVVFQLRLPRAVTAFVVGGMLGLAGVWMQILLRNPLADPYVLGVSGGAAVAALLAILLGWHMVGVSSVAAVGALASMFLVFVLSRGQGDWSTTRLLLTGVVLAAG